MSDIPSRLYRLARASLDSARARIEDVSVSAQSELDAYLRRAEADLPPASSADPMARAAARIESARQAVPARQELAPPADATEASALQTAYQILGVPPGADFLTVQQTVSKFRTRCAPDRFPAGSAEQAEAQAILKRVEDAYRVIQTSYGDQGGGRFDKLEI